MPKWSFESRNRRDFALSQLLLVNIIPIITKLQLEPVLQNGFNFTRETVLYEEPEEESFEEEPKPYQIGPK